MGCWNETCMVSNLPILDGDKVVMILLIPSHSFIDGTGYTNKDLFKPCSMPIFGDYDNYGSVTNITNANYTLEYLKDLNKRGFLNIENDFTDLESLLGNEMIGAKYSPSGFNPYHKEHKLVISRAFIKREFYDLLIKLGLNNSNYWDNEKTSSNIKDFMLKQFNKCVDNFIIRAMPTDLTKIPRSIEEDFHYAMPENKIREMLMEASLDRTNTHDIGFFARTYLYSVDKELIETVANFILVDYTMTRLGKTWISINTGSQDGHYDEQKELAELMLEIINQELEQEEENENG